MIIPTIPTSAFPPVNNLELSEEKNSSSPSTSSTQANNINGKCTPSTSKKWVLPPRPKPGRKSSSNNATTSITNNAAFLSSEPPERSDSISTSISHLRINSPASAPLTPDSLSPADHVSGNVIKAATATMITSSQKSSTNGASNTSISSKNATIGLNKTTARMVEIDSEIINNPIKQNILKINEENYYLKLEVIRLVSTLKSLRDDLNTTTSLTETHQDMDRKEKKIKKKIKKKSKSISSPPFKVEETDDLSKVESVDKETFVTTTTTTPKTLSPSLLFNPLQNSNMSNNSIPHSKKRSHDETNNDITNPDDDINNLIVSLVDLSHTQNSASASPQQSQNELNSDPTLVDIDIDVDDDMDMLSPVSTTPSTMFSLSLSLSTTNDTISTSIPQTIPTMQYINEQPTFELLDLPTEENLNEGKLDLKMNYELEDNDVKLPLLNTFDTLNSLDYESNFLMETTDLEKNTNISEGVSSNSLELLNFGTDEDVELEFSKFVNGERSI
ncbi:hypothetical protein CANINC_004004 [Pichia inconspicua]|uniref:Hap4 transcription factor heteromerisation domain-containing protein n=1 Tax=Pichia inconspicua TaxID=52247 RepID=A0A4T0WX99_9ASCO|nr:hypothetical protein CANINC_004004 [[Candida] inconspicua]